MSSILSALVHLMHRLTDQAELGHRAMVLDESCVRGTAGRTQLGPTADNFLASVRDQVGQLARLKDERFAADPNFEIVGRSIRRPVQLVANPDRETVGRVHIVKTDVETGLRLARNHVFRWVSDVDAGDLQAGCLRRCRCRRRAAPRSARRACSTKR